MAIVRPSSSTIDHTLFTRYSCFSTCGVLWYMALINAVAIASLQCVYGTNMRPTVFSLV